jgi:hypothetical protein
MRYLLLRWSFQNEWTSLILVLLFIIEHQAGSIREVLGLNLARDTASFDWGFYCFLSKFQDSRGERVNIGHLRELQDRGESIRKAQNVSVYKVAFGMKALLLKHAMWKTFNIILIMYEVTTEGPPLWSSAQGSWLQIQRTRVRFPSLPDFLRSSGSGTGSTQPREDNWGATWMEK